MLIVSWCDVEFSQTCTQQKHIEFFCFKWVGHNTECMCKNRPKSRNVCSKNSFSFYRCFQIEEFYILCSSIDMSKNFKEYVDAKIYEEIFYYYKKICSLYITLLQKLVPALRNDEVGCALSAGTFLMICHVNVGLDLLHRTQCCAIGPAISLYLMSQKRRMCDKNVCTRCSSCNFFVRNFTRVLLYGNSIGCWPT